MGKQSQLLLQPSEVELDSHVGVEFDNKRCSKYRLSYWSLLDGPLLFTNTQYTLWQNKINIGGDRMHYLAQWKKV